MTNIIDKQPTFMCQGKQALHGRYDHEICEGFTYDTWLDAAKAGWERIGHLRVCAVCNAELNRIADGLLANME